LERIKFIYSVLFKSDSLVSGSVLSWALDLSTLAGILCTSMGARSHVWMSMSSFCLAWFILYLMILLVSGDKN
jgi:hypothetical protein